MRQVKTRSLLTVLFLAFVKIIIAQTETLNQLSSDGKKDGKWILYLDYKGNKVKDSSAAVYWRYTYYDHGVHIYPMGGFIGKKGKIERISDNKQSGKIKMLDGEYRCYEKGKLKFIHVFEKGEYVSYKEFYPSGKIETFLITLNTLPNNQTPGTWLSMINTENLNTKSL